MLVRQPPINAISFINSKTSIREFYDYVTLNGTNFDFDINEQEKTSGNLWTPLHRACEQGNLELARAIICMGANVNCQMNDTYTPLAFAIKGKRLDIAKMLINNGACLDDEYNLKFGYVETAKLYKCPEIAEYIIESRSSQSLFSLIATKLYYQDDFRNASIEAHAKKHMIAIPDEKYYSDNTLKSVLPNCLLSIVTTTDYQTLIKYRDLKASTTEAVIANNLKELKKCLNNRLYIDISILTIEITNTLLRTAAVKHGNLEMVKLLVENHAVIFDYNHVSRTIVTDAARNNGHHEIADYLENIQKQRYEKLLQAAENQEKWKRYKLLKLGMFSDTGSALNQNLTQQISENESNKIVNAISRNL